MHTVASALLEEVDAGPGVRALDLGCGTGRLAIPLGERGAEVLAVDVSPAMVHQLEMQAKARGVDSIRGVAMPIEGLYLPPGSFDLVVSNYALHHLRDADKVRLVEAAFGWLRPGGRLVIADMMLGRGATTRDRAIIASKVRAMARKGLPGYWRILKNAFRFLLRVQERPLPPEVWSRLLSNAGFVEVQTRSVVAEAGIVAGRTPAA
jgi:SAM-dependent methyltransferase